MIAECAGLPGAGKSTICQAVTVPYGGKGSIPLWALKPNLDLLRAAYCIFVLAATSRPFSLRRLKRAFNLVFFLRHYQEHKRTILMDQGIVQKIWSILAGAVSFSESNCAATFAALRHYAPDIIIWVETPVEDVVHRLTARLHGASRYDGLSPDVARTLLARRATLLRNLAREFAEASGATFLEVDGHSCPQDNAALIDKTLSSFPT